MRVRDFAHGKVHVPVSKSGKPRHVVLTEEGAAFFAALTAGRAPQEFAFRRSDGFSWRTAHQARPMREACGRAAITPPVGFHRLRHTWASLAVMGGVPLMIVAKNLGHASTAMVERHYGHLAPSYVDEAIRAGAPRFNVARESDRVVLKPNLNT
jgi:integrase